MFGCKMFPFKTSTISDNLHTLTIVILWKKTDCWYKHTWKQDSQTYYQIILDLLAYYLSKIYNKKTILHNCCCFMKWPKRIKATKKQLHSIIMITIHYSLHMCHHFVHAVLKISCDLIGQFNNYTKLMSQNTQVHNIH